MERIAAPGLLAASLLIVLFHGGYLLWAGIAMAPDTLAYAHWSGRLIELGFDYAAVIKETNTDFPPVLYGAFVTLLASLRLAFGDSWPAMLVALNFAAHIALGLLLVRLTGRVTGSGFAAWTALLLFLGCHEIFKWVPFVISDTTFVFIAFSVFYLASARILGIAQGWLRIAALAVVAIFYRPTGAVLLPDLLWARFLSRTRFARVTPAAIGVGIALSAIATYVLFAWIVQDPARWPFDTLSAAVRMVSHGYSIGEVVNARPETYHAPPSGLAGFILLALDRLAHFFAPGAAAYSGLHWLIAAAFFLPTYALAAWLCAALCRGDTAFGGAERKVFVAAGGAVLAYALFHGLVQVDFDWRYRVPVLPHLILMASGGAADLLRRAALSIERGRTCPSPAPAGSQ